MRAKIIGPHGREIQAVDLEKIDGKARLFHGPLQDLAKKKISVDVDRAPAAKSELAMIVCMNAFSLAKESEHSAWGEFVISCLRAYGFGDYVPRESGDPNFAAIGDIGVKPS